MTEPRWLDEREQRAWRGFHRMRTQLLGELSRQLMQRSGISDADFAVLVELSEADGDRLRANELCRRLQWEKSRMSHQLARMAGRGLIDRRPSPDDARGQVVVLTAAGRSTIEAAAPWHVEAVRAHFIDLLTPEQLDALGDISAIVAANMPVDAREPPATC